MRATGTRNPSFSIAVSGFHTSGQVYYNLTEAELYEEAIRRGEAQLTSHGALCAKTGQHTGRSAKDKFVVRDAAVADQVWWDNNKPLEPQQFETLLADFRAHAADKDLFVQDLTGGADAEHQLPTRVITEFAWHSPFIRNLLIRPKRAGGCTHAIVAFLPCAR